MTRNTDNDGNPFDISQGLGGDPIYSNNYNVWLYGYARVNKGTGSSGGGTSTVEAFVN